MEERAGRDGWYSTDRTGLLLSLLDFSTLSRAFGLGIALALAIADPHYPVGKGEWDVLCDMWGVAGTS